MANRDVGAAFGSVGMDVYAFYDAGASAISPTGIESFEDFSTCRLQCVGQTPRGKRPPGR
jgi:hypothetical protein